jgi:hypothetical protein
VVAGSTETLRLPRERSGLSQANVPARCAHQRCEVVTRGPPPRLSLTTRTRLGSGTGGDAHRAGDGDYDNAPSHSLRCYVVRVTSERYKRAVALVPCSCQGNKNDESNEKINAARTERYLTAKSKAMAPSAMH